MFFFLTHDDSVQQLQKSPSVHCYWICPAESVYTVCRELGFYSINFQMFQNTSQVFEDILYSMFPMWKQLWYLYIWAHFRLPYACYINRWRLLVQAFIWTTVVLLLCVVWGLPSLSFMQNCCAVPLVLSWFLPCTCGVIILGLDSCNSLVLMYCVCH